MLLQFTMDTTQRKDVELAKNTLEYMLGFIPLQNQAQAGLAALGEAVKAAATPAAQTTAAPTVTDAPQPTEAPKPKRGKKEAATPATPAPTVASGGLDFTAVKAKLQSYSDDGRFGMNGVLAILGKYGVQRISALPEARYAEFAAEIDAALAAQPDPLA